MRDNEQKRSADERKQKIRDRYKGLDTSGIEVIPAKEIISLDDTTKIKRVAAYVRVSTDNDEQTSSYELQKNYYTEYITAQPGWELAGIYDDEGISGTSIEHRKGMLQMLEDARTGKIDLIITKSIARFARNIVDCLSIVEELKNLEPPVGVKFEADSIYTLDSNGRMILTILASVAEEESHSKSLIMNWSIDKRFSRGLFLTPPPVGYDKNEDGNLVINEEEAETVKVIYYLYLNGFSCAEIAELLTQYQRKTKLGNTEWAGGTINSIIQNERYCGDILARKTYTPNFLNHKSKKNRNNRTQYRQQDHHKAIVSREVFNAVNHMRASSAQQKNKPLPMLSVVNDGTLKGYVPMDKDWTGFSNEEYVLASESVMDGHSSSCMTSENEFQTTRPRKMNRYLDLSGYELVSERLFLDAHRMFMSIADGKLSFSTSCLRKFENVEYVEFLLNPIEKCVAIRPCESSNPNAIRWGKLKDERWQTRRVSARGIEGTLSTMFDWEENMKYRFVGNYFTDGVDQMLLFQLDEPEVVKVQEIIAPVKQEETPNEESLESDPETRMVKKKIVFYPPMKGGTFGRLVDGLYAVNIAEQKHYAGNWNVLCPATALNDMNVFDAKDLEALYDEANRIIEGWTV